MIESDNSVDEEILEEDQQIAMKSGFDRAFGVDLHPSKELAEAWAWNVQCVLLLAIYASLFVVFYPSFKVFGVTFAVVFAPLLLNIVWLLLPFRLKR